MRRYLTIFVALFLLLSPAFGAKKKKKEEKSQLKLTYSGPAYHGFSVLADVATPIISLTTSSYKTMAAEGSFNVNLYNQLFPTIEGGWGNVKKEYENGATYKASAPYFKIGLDYSLMGPYTKEGKPRQCKNYPFVGLRYGMSFMNYDMGNIVVTDPYWAENQIKTYHSDFTYCGWLEVVAGLKVNIIKGFTMGWSIRMKTLLHTNAPSKDFTWYVPGYGRSDAMNISFNYTIGYTFLK